MSAANALIAVSAQGRRAAAHDGGKHLTLRPGERPAISFQESVSCPADYVGHLPGWPRHYGAVANDCCVWPYCRGWISSSGLIAACR